MWTYGWGVGSHSVLQRVAHSRAYMEHEVGVTSDVYGDEELREQGFDRGTSRKETTWRIQS